MHLDARRGWSLAPMLPCNMVPLVSIGVLGLWAFVELIRFCFFALLAPFSDSIQNGRKRRVPLLDPGAERLVIFFISVFSLLVGRADGRGVLHQFSNPTQLSSVFFIKSLYPPATFFP